MAGNNAIQILRANSATIANSSETLLDGQLLYNTDKNYLTCGGGGNNKPVDSLPIVCQELAYYQGDANTISANTGNNNLVYRIGPNKLVNKLEIYSNSTIALNTNSSMLMNVPNGNINIAGTGITANLGSGSIDLHSQSGTTIKDSTGGPTLTLASPRATLYGHYLDLTGSNVTISGSNQIELNSNGLSSIYLNGINANMFAEGLIEINSVSGGINITAQSSGQLNLHGDSGVTISAYDEVRINRAGSVISFPNNVGTVALTSDIPAPKEYCKVLYNGSSVTSYTIRNSTDWGMILCLVQYDSRGVYGVPVMFDPQVAAQAQACIPAIRASQNTIYWGTFKTVKNGNNTTVSGQYWYERLDGSYSSNGSVYIKQVIGFCPV